MARAQIKPTTSEPYDIRFRLAGEYQYRNLPLDYNLNFAGLNGEASMNYPVGISGSILFGWGNRDLAYLHLPPLGILMFTVSAILLEPDEDLLIFLLFENFHYYFRIGSRLTISPYINLMGLDISTNTGDQLSHNLLSSGPGVNMQVTIYKQLVFSSEIGTRYLWVTDKNRFGKDDRVLNIFSFSLGMSF
ncbi:MAG: hypothetical protein EH225_13395 [Calditrichaeota bacterium]|nr:hypothetical protein [Calditrichota bacterium]RQV98386.1 MAG: hypothetical protein EH225_13395 [Calditrichota bacterium]